jgi:hypothetical protein
LVLESSIQNRAEPKKTHPDQKLRTYNNQPPQTFNQCNWNLRLKPTGYWKFWLKPTQIEKLGFGDPKQGYDMLQMSDAASAGDSRPTKKLGFIENVSNAYNIP